MRQDLTRRGRERSARQVVQRWEEELPVVPAFCSSRLAVFFPEVTVSAAPVLISYWSPYLPIGGDLVPFASTSNKVGPFL